MRKWIWVFLLIGGAAQAKALEVMQAGGVRVGIQAAEGRPAGDMLFINGMGDRLESHQDLFTEWSRKGFRVIALDSPLDSGVLSQVEVSTRVDDRPLMVVAAGSAASQLRGVAFSRGISGLILLSPRGSLPATKLLMPTLALFSGSDMASTSRWVREQQSLGSPILAATYFNGEPALDNSADEVTARQTRRLSADFALQILGK